VILDAQKAIFKKGYKERGKKACIINQKGF
jgi:hypothetical protein